MKPVKLKNLRHQEVGPMTRVVGVGSSSGPGPRARAGMGPVGWARGSPRGPVEPASPRGPAEPAEPGAEWQYFVVLCSTK